MVDTPASREQLLDQAIIARAAQGGRVEHRTPDTVVMVMGKPVNHVLHLLLSLFCTCGLWVPVWLLLAAFGGEQRRILTVGPDGDVVDRRGPLELWRKILIGVAAFVLLMWLIGMIGTLAGAGK